MPTPGPLHERQLPLCDTWLFKDWAGRIAVCAYDINVEREYWAVRQAAGVIDVSPLYKYDFHGPDAARTLARLAVRDIGRIEIGRVAYTCWCDDRGLVIDDGTVTRLGEEHFRLTAAEPALDWLLEVAAGADVEVMDTSRELAALAVQGPRSRKVLGRALGGTVDEGRGASSSPRRGPGGSRGPLPYFAARPFVTAGLEGRVTRTGYTGDLGYEVWVSAEDGVRLWDQLFGAGADYNLQPVGLDALDILRIEAGYLLHGVDYYGAHEEPRRRQLSTPFELGWSWMVQLDREPFVGQEALRQAADSPHLQFVGLALDFAALTDLYAEYDLPPHLPAAASRQPLPVYDRGGRQVGQVTSSCWSSLLKQPLALASVEPRFAAAGSTLEVEHTVDYDRRRVPAAVTRLPFYDPPWRKA